VSVRPDWLSDHLDELAEKFVSDLARRATHQARSHLSKLTADLQGRRVAQRRIAAALGERYVRATFTETRRPTLTDAANGVTVRRIQIRKLDTAFEARFDGSKLGFHLRQQLGSRNSFDALTSGYALCQNLGVVESLPHLLALCRYVKCSADFHARARLALATAAQTTIGSELHTRWRFASLARDHSDVTDRTALQSTVWKLHQRMAVSAHDDITAYGVQAMIAIQVTLLHGAVVIKFYAGIAVRLRQRRRDTEHGCNGHNNDDFACPIAISYWAAFQGEAPPYPATQGRADRIRVGQDVPDELAKASTIRWRCPRARWQVG